jgi:hypothetical protein
MNGAGVRLQPDPCLSGRFHPHRGIRRRQAEAWPSELSTTAPLVRRIE